MGSTDTSFDNYLRQLSEDKLDSYIKGACKYYISTLGVGGGSEGNAYFAYVVRGGGGLEAKCLYCLCKGSKFFFT